MKTALFRLLPVLAALALPVHAATDAEVEARRVATELAGAFSNDGFKLRDGCWQGQLAPKHAKLIQVNLYAGNQYWFSVGTTAGLVGGGPRVVQLSIRLSF